MPPPPDLEAAITARDRFPVTMEYQMLNNVAELQKILQNDPMQIYDMPLDQIGREQLEAEQRRRVDAWNKDNGELMRRYGTTDPREIARLQREEQRE